MRQRPFCLILLDDLPITLKPSMCCLVSFSILATVLATLNVDLPFQSPYPWCVSKPI